MALTKKFRIEIQKYLKKKGIYVPLSSIKSDSWAFELYKKFKRKPKEVKLKWH